MAVPLETIAQQLQFQRPHFSEGIQAVLGEPLRRSGLELTVVDSTKGTPVISVSSEEKRSGLTVSVTSDSRVYLAIHDPGHKELTRYLELRRTDGKPMTPEKLQEFIEQFNTAFPGYNYKDLTATPIMAQGVKPAQEADFEYA